MGAPILGAFSILLGFSLFFWGSSPPLTPQFGAPDPPFDPPTPLKGGGGKGRGMRRGGGGEPGGVERERSEVGTGRNWELTGRKLGGNGGQWGELEGTGSELGGNGGHWRVLGGTGGELKGNWWVTGRELGGNGGQWGYWRDWGTEGPVGYWEGTGR